MSSGYPPLRGSAYYSLGVQILRLTPTIIENDRERKRRIMIALLMPAQRMKELDRFPRS
jgi:hypothetical protein